MKRFSIIAIAIFGVLMLSSAAFGQCVSLTTIGSAATQNFDTLSNTAGSTTNNLTITGWFMTESGGGARDNEQYAVDTGGSNTGDTYSYGAAASTDRALGGLRTGTLAPLFGACYTNNTGATINSLNIAYTGEEWRLGTAARTDQINFEYSTNATDLVTGTWTGVSALNFVTPDTATTGAKNGNAANARTALSSTISTLSIANGATFWIRWTDVDVSGADDGLAVDDFSLTPQSAPPLPNLSINDVSQSEGNAGTTTFSYTVSLSALAPAGGITFDIATADGTATIADNDYVTNTLTGQTIPAGSSTYNFNVSVNGDTTVEANETFFVNVTNVTGANVTDGQGQGTIVNDDVALPTVEFEGVNYREDESQTLVMRVVRSGDTSGTTTVDYSVPQNNLGSPATGGASCTMGVDYITPNGTLTFAADETEQFINVPICGDTLVEGIEVFPVELSNPTNATLGEITTAYVDINDTASQFANTDQITIGFGNDGNPYPSTLTVSGAPSSITSMRLTLYDFSHFNSDRLDLLLVGPQGQKFIIMGDAGGGGGLISPATITFDDNAFVFLPDNATITTGSYKPTSWEQGQTNFPAPAPAGPYIEPFPGGVTLQPLGGGIPTLASTFSGTNPNGTWQLYIRDDGAGQPPPAVGIGGFINGGWALQFVGPTAASVSVGGQLTVGKNPVVNQTVMLTGGNLNEPRLVKTNSLGNYTFEGLEAGQTYIVTVLAGRYYFPNPTKILNVEDSVFGADFEAEER